MASTVDSATLKVQIKEDITLNGTKRGAQLMHEFKEITQVDERVLTVPTYEVGVLLLSSSAGPGTYESGSFKYARITNLDDKNGAFMLQNTKAKKYTYAIKKNAYYKVKLLEHQFSGMLIKIKNQEVWTSLIGGFNMQNILAVYAVAELFEFSQLDILKQISCLKNVEGRFQIFQTPNRITVIIDYAHTPNALENVLETINKIRTRNEKLFTLLGCGGNRDQEKRPIMGQIASKHSDKVIFTSDNPRHEDPEKIISQMIDGVSQENFKKISKITLREEAIATSAKLAQDGDVVLIAGKGHESYQEIQGKYYPFNDLEVAKQIFLNLD